ncbi:MAG: SRPBCC domain-containing protein [Myxococcales bacterium]|nr:SRPBCC domain-containing protein [Myxococcales bacterium]
MSTNAAEKTESTFRLRYAVACTIAAKPAQIWSLLTDAARFPVWNSTVSRLDGTIALGERLALQVPLAPGRTFRPRVTALTEGASMEWRDGMAPMFRGVRRFELTPNPDGTTEFSMVEELSGIMLPMIKRSLPDFRDAFSTYAADLKRAAEGAS